MNEQNFEEYNSNNNEGDRQLEYNLAQKQYETGKHIHQGQMQLQEPGKDVDHLKAKHQSISQKQLAQTFGLSSNKDGVLSDEDIEMMKESL